MKILNELKWIAEQDDIDHKIRDIAHDAVDEINSLVEQLHILASEIQVLYARIEQMEIDKDLAENVLVLDKLKSYAIIKTYKQHNALEKSKWLFTLTVKTTLVDSSATLPSTLSSKPTRLMRLIKSLRITGCTSMGVWTVATVRAVVIAGIVHGTTKETISP